MPAVKIQYRDNQTMVNDLFAGSIDFIANDAGWSVEQVKADMLKAIKGAAPSYGVFGPVVETANVGINSVTLAAGGSHTMSAMISVEKA